MITIPPTEFSQILCPIPAIHEEIEFAGAGKVKRVDDLFSQADLGLKGTTSLGAFWMIELSPQGHEKISIQKSRDNPLVTEDRGHLLGMILIPGTSRNLFSRFSNEGIINKKKDDRLGFDMQGMEELIQGNLCDLFHRPEVLPKETGKA